MDINVEVSGTDNERMAVVDETVEVVDGGVGGLRASVSMTGEQQLIVTHAQDVLVPNSEVQIETQPIDPVTIASMHTASMMMSVGGPPSPGVGSKRSHTQAELSVSTAEQLLQSTASSILTAVPQASIGDIPRKKSRNYLDSHKTIEKKRRDRINACLDSLKNLVPDCRQYGSKKLDKAEILEMTIEYIQRLQAPGANRNTGNLDLSMGQREWANDLTTWVINNKLLYSGPNSLDQFSQALLLHLQGMGSGNALASATSMLLNQTNANTEEDALLRQQTVTAQAAILQHLQQQVSPTKDNNSSAQQQLQQAQLTQLQALLLLQQQQQLLNQQQAQETDAQSQQSHLQQLQQLQQLQALLLQHIASEATNPNGTDNIVRKPSDEQGAESVAMAATSVANVETQSSENPSVELAQADELGGAVGTEETVYTSALAETLGENLLQVSVSTQSAQGDPSNEGQMWSSAGSQSLMLGGGDTSGGIEDPSKGQLTVQEEVELLVHQEP